MAELLSRSFRQEDFLIRYGGDEFVVIAPGSGVEAARGRARQAGEALEDYSFVAENSDRRVELKLSFSIGVASFPHDGTTGEARRPAPAFCQSSDAPGQGPCNAALVSNLRRLRSRSK